MKQPSVQKKKSKKESLNPFERLIYQMFQVYNLTCSVYLIKYMSEFISKLIYHSKTKLILECPPNTLTVIKPNRQGTNKPRVYLSRPLAYDIRIIHQIIKLSPLSRSVSHNRTVTRHKNKYWIPYSGSWYVPPGRNQKTYLIVIDLSRMTWQGIIPFQIKNKQV